ncbi:uncharacterized protein CCDC198 isoform X3 [Lutra lutra]|uniref:uncharacterized protein CCDC198 isoform X3 n=1 Tax=Lutra lutra TaxID=9657 RepID=UPI001FD31ED5|nr:uncharacterized protein CCDC198 isoform X3 [Lutra lutra]
MGLSHSKAHRRVTKVAPLRDKEGEAPSASPMDLALNQNLEEKSSYLFARLQDPKKALEGQLPPLRETWCGRYSAVPRAMYFDIPLEHGETSIIKRHPPRRLQELEKKMQTPGYTPRKRQYLHKMRMLEMNRNRQEKKSLRREARSNKQKPRDHKAKKILQSVPRNDDRDLPTLLPNETLNRRSPGNSQNEDLGEHQARNDCCPQKIGKMETWLSEQEAWGQLLWDSSSSDSEELRKSEKKPQALVRTRTERIPLFDEFFD